MAAGVDEARVQAAGRALAAALPSRSRRPLKALDDRAMDLASQDEQLRAALFRFVDVVPACRSLDDLAAHLTGFLDEVGDRPVPIDVAMRMGDSRAGRAALGATAAAGVRHMAHRFIVGETPARRRPHPALALGGRGRHLGRPARRGDGDQRRGRPLRGPLRGGARRARRRLRRLPARPALEADDLGAIPRANLSVKVSALTPLLRPDAPELGKRDAEPRLRGLLRSARDLGAHLHIDMESFDSREADRRPRARAAVRARSSPRVPSAGLVLQAYLVDSPELCERILAWAGGARRAHPLVVRLVKGAYWDQEVVEARQHGWSAPVFEVKADCDRNFEQLTVRLLDARASGTALRPAIASHNLRSVAHAVAANRALGLGDREVEFQVLRGLGDDLQHALAAGGHRVRTYCPVGDLVAGMAYLVRRLLENTSNESFLHEQASGRPLEELLAAP